MKDSFSRGVGHTPRRGKNNWSEHYYLADLSFNSVLSNDRASVLRLLCAGPQPLSYPTMILSFL